MLLLHGKLEEFPLRLLLLRVASARSDGLGAWGMTDWGMTGSD
jgi:hypothetical protein